MVKCLAALTAVNRGIFLRFPRVDLRSLGNVTEVTVLLSPSHSSLSPFLNSPIVSDSSCLKMCDFEPTRR